MILPRCLFLLISCSLLLACQSGNQPAQIATASPGKLIQTQDNPMGSEGQRVYLKLQIAVAEVKGLEQAPKNAQGLLDAQGATFKVAQENGAELATGSLSDNTITVPAEQLGNGPYILRITLPTGEILNVRLQDTLSAGETRVIRSSQVTVTNSQQCEGDNCVAVGGDVNVEQKNVTVGGDNCVALNCTLQTQETP